MFPIGIQESAVWKTSRANLARRSKLILIAGIFTSLLISSCGPPQAIPAAVLGGGIMLGRLFEEEVKTARRQFTNKQYEAALDTLDRAANQRDPNVRSLRQEIKSKMRSEPPLAFRLAQRELKAGSYTEAAEDFRIALRGSLLNKERLEALDGRCLAYSQTSDIDRAYRACSEATKEPGSGSQDRLMDAAYALRIKHGRAVDSAIAQNRGSEARDHWHNYKDLPGARQDLVQRWNKEIVTVERRNKEEADRQERLREARRKEMERSARQRLSARYSFVTRFTKDRFERWVEANTTVLGVRLFDRAEISGNNLYLWLCSSDFFGPNLRLFAQYGDAFAVWCRCSAVTYVGVDYAHLGGANAILARFVFDSEKGQSIAR